MKYIMRRLRARNHPVVIKTMNFIQNDSIKAFDEEECESSFGL